MIKEMLGSGIKRRIYSPCASLVVLVKKKDNSWHMCVDYREHNQHTIKDNFPVLIIEDLLDRLHGAVYFSKLDLRFESSNLHESE